MSYRRFGDVFGMSDLTGWAACAWDEEEPPPNHKNDKPDEYSEFLLKVMRAMLDGGYEACRKEFPGTRFKLSDTERLMQRIRNVAYRNALPIKVRKRGDWVYMVRDPAERDGRVKLE